MNHKHAIGIDVSKQTLDVVCHTTSAHIQVENNQKGFSKMLTWVNKQVKTELDQTLFCFEHTGLYSRELAVFCHVHQLFFCIESPVNIKRSLGLKRGKNDKVDAREIAHYAYLRRDELKVYRLPAAKVQQLQLLLTQREQLVTQRAGLISVQNEQKRVLVIKEHKLVFDVYEKMIAYLSKQIERIEAEMKTIVTSDTELKKNFRLVTSIKGIGDIIGYYLLVNTDCFTRFQTWRQFSCYCGIAPFDHESGTSLKAGKHVHPMGHRKIKSLLFLAASTAIQFDQELKAYYERRLSEGKNRMYTLNAIKNKLIARVFAVVKRQTPYVQIHRHAA
jgi:transposase